MRLIEELFTGLVRHEYGQSMSFAGPAEAGGRPRPGTDRQYQLYIHIPFCPVLCPFCSFHRVEFHPDRVASYFNALRKEIEQYHQQGFVFDDLYVGGGTPTVAPTQLLKTLELVNRLFPLKSISVETNPSDLRPDLLGQLRDQGVQRLSVGVQSFSDELLRSMGRYEKYGSSEQICDAIRMAKGRFRTLNVDMIFNLPGQDFASLEHDLSTLLSLMPEQVSYYPLMMADSVQRRMSSQMGPLGKSDSRRMFDMIVEALSRCYQRSTAWCFSSQGEAIDEYIVDRDEYLGLGSGSFSYIDGVIHASTFSINGYCQRIGNGASAITRSRRLSKREQMRHDFLMKLFGMRMEKAWIKHRWGPEFYLRLALELAGMWSLGALRLRGPALSLTPRGEYYWVIMMREFFNNVNVFRDEMRRQIGEEFRAMENHKQASSDNPRTY
jgi:coproporphyrinogen III oxidase-like Fe-S oxidoreductase